MAKKVIANGKEFEFDDNATEEQIGSAIDEYFGGEAVEAEKKNGLPQSSPTSNELGGETPSTYQTTPISKEKGAIQEQPKYKPLPLLYDKSAALKTKYGIQDEPPIAYQPQNMGEISSISKHKKQISENNKILQTINEGVNKQNEYLQSLEQQYNNTPDADKIKKEAMAIQYNNIVQQQKDFSQDYNDLQNQNKVLENTDARTQENLNKAIFDQLSNTKLFKGNEQNVNTFFDTLKKSGNYTDEQIEKAKAANVDLQKLGVPVKTNEQVLKEKEEQKKKETNYLGSMFLSLNESFDKGIIAPFDAAAKLVNTLTFGALETQEDVRNKAINGNTEGRFTELGKWSQQNVEDTRENNFFGSSNTPEGVLGGVLTGLASLPPMLITMPLFEGVPLGAATSDMLGAAQKVAPAFATQMGTINFLNKYGETGNVLESTKEFGKGAVEGAMMHLIGADIGAGKAISRPTGAALEFLNKGLGVNSESVSKLAEDIYKGQQLSKVSSVLANGGLFGAYSTAEEFANTQEADSRTFWSNAALGSALAGLGLFGDNGKPRPKAEIEQIIADKIKNNAVVNYFSTPISQINEVKTSGKTPEEIRTQANIIGEQAVKEKDANKKYAYFLAQHKMNALADAVAMDNIFAENPEKAIKTVENSSQLTPEQKEQFINKINETAEAQYHAKQEAENSVFDALNKIEKNEPNNKIVGEKDKVSEPIELSTQPETPIEKVEISEPPTSENVPTENKVTQKQVDEIKYKVTEPKTHTLIKLPIDRVIALHEEHQEPIGRGQNEKSDTRIDNAKKHIVDEVNGKNDKPTTATYLAKLSNGNLMIGDGRRRLIAMKELGIKDAWFEVAKEDVENIKNKVEPPTSENGVAEKGSVKTPDVSESEMGNDVVGRKKALVNINKGLEDKQSILLVSENGEDASVGNVTKIGVGNDTKIKLTQEEKGEVKKQFRLYNDGDLTALEFNNWRKDFSDKVLNRVKKELESGNDVVGKEGENKPIKLDGLDNSVLNNIGQDNRDAINFLRSYPDNFIGIEDANGGAEKITNITNKGGAKIEKYSGYSIQLNFKNDRTKVLHFKTEEAKNEAVDKIYEYVRSREVGEGKRNTTLVSNESKLGDNSNQHKTEGKEVKSESSPKEEKVGTKTDGEILFPQKIEATEIKPYTEVEHNYYKPNQQLKFNQGTYEPVRIIAHPDIIKAISIGAKLADNAKRKLVSEIDAKFARDIAKKFGFTTDNGKGSAILLNRKAKELAKENRTNSHEVFLIIGDEISSKSKEKSSEKTTLEPKKEVNDVDKQQTKSETVSKFDRLDQIAEQYKKGDWTKELYNERKNIFKENPKVKEVNDNFEIIVEQMENKKILKKYCP